MPKQPLYHYSSQPIEDVWPDATQAVRPKPRGLWVSVGTAWADWCRAESFGLERLTHRHEITLTDSPNILYCNTINDLRRLNIQFSAYQDPLQGLALDWPAIAQRYAGIIIVPWIRRAAVDTRLAWYAGWDCASGCIWSSAAIARIDRFPPEEPCGGKDQDPPKAPRNSPELLVSLLKRSRDRLKADDDFTKGLRVGLGVAVTTAEFLLKDSLQ